MMCRSFAWCVWLLGIPLAGCGSSRSSNASNVDAGDHSDAANTPDARAGDSGSDATRDATVDSPTDALNSSDGAGGGGSDSGNLPLGEPISAPNDQWTWVDFPDSVCGDGTATGIAVNPSSTSSNLLVFLNGGGACWDYTTCFTLHTAVSGPFGSAEFNQTSSAMAGSILDRSVTNNPFKNYSFVFVPYCTGDLHAGSKTMTYSSAGLTEQYHHQGHANMLAYLQRIAATFKSPGKLVVSGSSSGGGGALFNYPDSRAYYPAAKAYLIDDSFPLLGGTSIPSGYLTAWYSNWDLGKVLDPECGTACKSDLSLFVKSLTQSKPNDRMALLSSLQDKTMSAYFLLSASGFQTALQALATDVLDPSTNFKHYFIAGNTHTMLGNPSATAVGPLWTWLAQMESDAPGWASVQ